MRVVALDPGGTTGLAFNHNDQILISQIDTPNHNQDLRDILNRLDPAVVVCEDFLFRQSKTKVDLVSRDYIGVARLWCDDNGRELVLQTPAAGKAFWTDDKLKALGYYTPAMPHANDAVRHLLYYFTFTCDDNYYLMRLKDVRENSL